MNPTSSQQFAKKYHLASIKDYILRELHDGKKILHFLDHIPEYLKSGPWSPAVYIVVSAFAGFILLTIQRAIASYDGHDYTQSTSIGPALQYYRLIVGVYGIIVMMNSYKTLGLWPFASYTLTSWNLMTLRLLTSFFAGLGSSNMAIISDALKYPALVGCSITFLLWWLVFAPLIDFLLWKSPENRRFFWKFNLSFGLVNVHILNLPFIAIEFLLTNKPLTFFDLWCGLFFALFYCVFYLNVLDAIGLHLYIIFTPRSIFSIFSYAMIIAFYYSFYLLWNYILHEFPLVSAYY